MSLKSEAFDSPHALALVAAALIVIPALAAFAYITTFGINVVNYDQYEFLPLIEKLRTGQLTFDDLYAQHNEHRILFPRLAMLAIASVTNYNTVAEMWFSWLLAACTLAIIFLLYRKHVGSSPLALLAFTPVAWLVFSLRQTNNLLWGWQIQIFLCVLAFVVALYYLYRSRGLDSALVAAIVAATVSTFSFVNGLLSWPVGLAFILLSRGKAGTRTGIVWSVAGAILGVAYFAGWRAPSHHPSIFYALGNIPVAIQYFFINVGSPIAFEKAHALASGVLLVALIITVLFVMTKRKLLSINAVWVAMIAFSLATSLACLVGRSGFGVEQALTSRYTTLTTFAVIGTYIIIAGLFIRSLENREMNTILTLSYGALLSLIILGLIVGYTGGLYFGANDHASFESMRDVLLHYKDVPDSELTRLYPDAQKIREGAAILEKYRLNVFS